MALSPDQIRIDPPADPVFDSARLRVDLNGDGVIGSGEPEIVLTGLARADLTVEPTDEGDTLVRLVGPDLPLVDLPLASQVNGLYVAYFGRAGEPAGVAYWTEVYQADLTAGMSARDALTRMAEEFRWSPEAIGRFPVLDPSAAAEATDSDVRGFLEAAYSAVFNRRPEPEGADFWTETLLTRIGAGGDIGGALVNIIAAASDARPEASESSNDATTVLNKIGVANATSRHLDDNDLKLGEDVTVAEVVELIEAVTDRFATVDASLNEIAVIGLGNQEEEFV
jgi:hypothetical protein